MTAQISFIPGTPQINPEPLARYLPPLPQGLAKAWLEQLMPLRERNHAWVLDPFNAAPQLPAEAARAGYRVLVAANNPVARFLLEQAAFPPIETELRSALADLAAVRKGDERLEPHIRSLYTTECEQCRREIMADAFLWEKDAGAPYARIYHCPYCGDTGERPASQADAARAAQYSPASLHRARALERVAPRNDPDRAHAEEAISAYLPRSVYALFTILNKVDGLNLSPSRRRYLDALLLFALDRANTMWPYPTARARPRQLVIPTRFRENNIWLALEEAIQLLASTDPAVPCTIWPQKPPESGGIAIFEGRLKDLIISVPEIVIGAVLAAIPRPNQAFWTLSALWAGWLWGREAVGPFKSVLRRRRYDWAWHSMALHAALSSLTPVLPENTPLLGLIGEIESPFLTAGILAAESAAFDLQDIALQEETGQAQIAWRSRKEPLQISTNDETRQQTPMEQAAVQGAQSHLLTRAEPTSYLHLHAAALSEIISSHSLPAGDDQSVSERYSQVNELLGEAFSYRNGFLRYGGSAKNPESGQWWLHDPAGNSYRSNVDSHSDRVEIEIVNNLLKQPRCTLREIDANLYQDFPGLFTPDPVLITTCLESYGISEPANTHHPLDTRWQLRSEDRPQNRRLDLDSMRNYLTEIAERLGYQVELPLHEERPVRTALCWSSGEETVYNFFLTTSAVVGRVIFPSTTPPANSVIVLPGSRASLVVYKLRRDPRLRLAVETGWRFLKFRQLRWLHQNVNLSRDMIGEQLVLDPLAEEDPQMRLL